MNVQVNCKTCEKTFLVPKYRLKHGQGKFCSRICQWESRKGIVFNKTHGLSNTRFFKIWQAMRRRVNDKNYRNYARYGGKGIKVCERWYKFENFRDDMYESYVEHFNRYGAKDTSIDRIDNAGNYEPNNCRWATLVEQRRNTSVYRETCTVCPSKHLAKGYCGRHYQQMTIHGKITYK